MSREVSIAPGGLCRSVVMGLTFLRTTFAGTAVFVAAALALVVGGRESAPPVLPGAIAPEVPGSMGVEVPTRRFVIAGALPAPAFLVSGLAGAVCFGIARRRSHD